MAKFAAAERLTKPVEKALQRLERAREAVIQVVRDQESGKKVDIVRVSRVLGDYTGARAMFEAAFRQAEKELGRAGGGGPAERSAREALESLRALRGTVEDDMKAIQAARKVIPNH